MLKSTLNPLTREQFSKLREARQLIKQQFDAQFLLQSEHVIHDLYRFALESETNELFQLFTELNEISNPPVPRPLNEEQFVMLRQAKGLVDTEFGQSLPLKDTNVMDRLYEFSLASVDEDLFDIYTYLASRAEAPDTQIAKFSGPHFRQLRKAKRIINEQFEQDIELHSDSIAETLSTFAQRSDDATLIETVAWLSNQRESTPGESELLFKALSASSFQRLRRAKLSIREEFDEEFSLHAESAIDDLYDYALRSEGVALFDLVYDLSDPQMAASSAVRRSRDWYSREQFTLLRNAREAIKTELGESLQLQSKTLGDELYQFALRSNGETLFDLCWQLQEMSALNIGGTTLPSKDEFRMLRRARTLVDAEFSQELRLSADVMESDLYKYAVNSESDDLFDLYTALMRLSSNSTSASAVESAVRLAKDELVTLRVARRLILKEFGEHIALEAADVLDRVYEFALKSDGEELFDLHSELNAKALQEPGLVETEQRPKHVESEPGNATSTAPKADQRKFRLQQALHLWDNPSHSKQHDTATKELTPEDRAIAKPEPAPPPPVAPPIQATPPILDKPETSIADALVRAMERSDEEQAMAKPEPTQPALADPPVLVAPPLLDKPETSIADAFVRTMEPSSKKVADEKSITGDAVKDVIVDIDDIVVSEPVNQNSETVNKSNIVDNDKCWYIGPLNNSFRMRLANPLSVETNGELVVAPAKLNRSSAIIEVVANRPVISVRSPDLLVNDHPIEDKYELDSGDTITVAASVLKVEYVRRDPESNGVAHSSGSSGTRGPRRAMKKVNAHRLN